MKNGCYEYNDLPGSYRCQAKCGICENLDLTKTKRDYYGKTTYYCKAKRDYVKMDKEVCPSTLITRGNYSRLGSYKPSGCYITTIMCEILGYSDDCEILTVMRAFRDEYLKLHAEYIPILLEYDQIGPKICEKIREDEDNYRLALEAMKYYLLPCASAYKSGNPLEALKIYQNMIQRLRIMYGLESFVIDINAPYDIDTVGKGRIRSNEEVLATC